MYPIERIEQVCGDWTLTIARTSDDNGRLNSPITLTELERVFLDTIGQEAGVTKASDFVLSVQRTQADCNGIDEVGLYSLSVALKDGSDTSFNIWVVPTQNGEHPSVQFRQHGWKSQRDSAQELACSHVVRLTREQVAAIAYALGHLSHANEEGNFHCAMIAHLRSLVTSSKHIAG